MLKQDQKPTPDTATIAAHLRHITRRWGELDQPVVLEVVFLTADDVAKVKNVARFAHDETGIAMAADHVAAMNRYGVNAYAVVNPVDATHPLLPESRASKQDIVASFFHWADADSAEAAENIKNFVGPKCTFYVLTGTQPCVRPHVYWELDEPTRNLAAWEATQRAIAATLKTDRSVVDPPRIMRIGGSVNWPKPQKLAKGYAPEVTTLRIYDADERPPVESERMARAFAASAQPASSLQQTTGTPGALFHIDTGEIHGKTAADYADILRRARTDGEKHGGVRDLTSSLAGMGVSRAMAEAIVREACPVWDKGVEALIDTAYAKFFRPNDLPAFDALPDAATPTDEAFPTPYDFFDDSALEPRQWLYARHYLRKFVSVLASAGGIGKTSMQIVEALALCTGRPLLGETVHEPCKVWLINLEDPMDEMQRRILAAMKFYGIKPEEVRGKLFVNAGRDFSINFAVQTREGITPNKALVAYLIKRIPELGIGATFIDPFVGAHMINENDNMAVNAVVAEIRKVADLTNSAIGLVHHIRKSNGEEATIDSVRGAVSLIGAARAARIVNRVSVESAASLGIDAKTAVGLFRVDDGKANLAPPAVNAVYRRMEGVQIANGDWVGVAAPFKLPDEWGGMDDETVNEMLRMIDLGIADPDGNEEYYSLRPQDKDRWVGTVILTYPFDNPEHAKNLGQAKKILQTWQNNGLLEEFEYRSVKQRKDRKGVRTTGRVGVMQ